MEIAPPSLIPKGNFLKSKGDRIEYDAANAANTDST